MKTRRSAGNTKGCSNSKKDVKTEMNQYQTLANYISEMLCYYEAHSSSRAAELHCCQPPSVCRRDGFECLTSNVEGGWVWILLRVGCEAAATFFGRTGPGYRVFPIASVMRRACESRCDAVSYVIGGEPIAPCLLVKVAVALAYEELRSRS